ncbi:MAG: hypothetical protein LLG44_01800 [Chloroflexi bacterium]|nr:hypothetical protein [Chloroflexota bacterium]
MPEPRLFAAVYGKREIRKVIQSQGAYFWIYHGGYLEEVVVVNSADGRLVGFLGVYPTRDKRGFIGGLLVTDNMGKPEEFRVSLPIKPNMVQRTLYGESLIRHIGVNLCGQPLYNSLKTKNELILLLVENPEWLILAESITCLVAHVVKPGEKKGYVYLNDELTVNKLESPNTKEKSLYIQYPSSYFDDKQLVCHDIIGSFTEYMDLGEPFSRIEKALDVLSTENEQFT